MRQLVRLITPPGGRLIDPFMGAGTMGAAAEIEGFDFTGIEQGRVQFQVAQARLTSSLPLFFEPVAPPSEESAAEVEPRAEQGGLFGGGDE
jgi:DNA modification methylase